MIVDMGAETFFLCVVILMVGGGRGPRRAHHSRIHQTLHGVSRLAAPMDFAPTAALRTLLRRDDEAALDGS